MIHPHFMKTTNYYNTLITVAEDCKLQKAQVPPMKDGKKTIANQHFERITSTMENCTSDDVIFETYAARNEIHLSQWDEERTVFFSKGQPCLRTSPLAKKYGWGIWSNNQGLIQLVAIESEAYQKLLEDKTIIKVKAMRSSRA